MRKEKVNVLYRVIKAVVFLLCCFYLGRSIFKYSSEISESLTAARALGLIGVAFVYAMIYGSLGWAWGLMAGLPGRDLGKAWRIYGYTQIGKYLPGNVFHFVGRSFYAHQENIRISSTVMASILESLFLVCAAFFWGGIGFSAHIEERLHVDVRVIAGAMIIGLAALVWAVRRPPKLKFFPEKLKDEIERYSPPGMEALAGGMALCLIFFLLTGALAWLLIRGLYGNFDGTLFMMVGVYSLAWFIGFITPGSPGGLGVREATFVALLGAVHPADQVFVFALFFRLITVLGDVFLFLLAVGMGKLKKK